jgi:hypothetical protein
VGLVGLKPATKRQSLLLARHRIGGVDLGQGENLADVVAGIEPALLQAPSGVFSPTVIGSRVMTSLTANP